MTKSTRHHILATTLLLALVSSMHTSCSSNVTAEDLDNGTPVIEQIKNAPVSDKYLGLLFGLSVVFLMVGYRRLEKKNEAKDRDLQTRQQEHAQVVRSRDETIDTLKHKLTGYETREAEAARHDGMACAMRSDICRQFREMADRPLQQPSDEQWRQLADMIDEQLPGFRRVVHGGYTPSGKEYRICLLALLAFKPGQMANLTGCTSSDVSKTRQRLLTRLFDEEGSAACFDKRLRTAAEAE